MDGYQPIEGWRGSWEIVGDTAQSLDPNRTVPVDALMQRIASERKLGRDGSRDFDNRNPLATERTVPSTAKPVETPPPAFQKPTPLPDLVTRTVLSGQGWRVEAGIDQAQMAIRVFDDAAVSFGGLTFPVRDGRVAGPPDVSGMVCFVVGAKTTVTVAVIDQRSSRVDAAVTGERWRETFGSVLAIAALTNVDRSVLTTSDGRVFEQKCSSLPK